MILEEVILLESVGDGSILRIWSAEWIEGCVIDLSMYQVQRQAW